MKTVILPSIFAVLAALACPPRVAGQADPAGPERSGVVPPAPPPALPQIEDQMEIVQHQAREVQASLARAQQALELAQSDGASQNVPEPPSSSISVGAIGGRWYHGQERATILRSSELEAQAMEQLQEDLMVMSRVLDRAISGKLGDSRQQRATELEIFLPGGAPSRTLFLEDYGAVFVLPVNFPLMAPAKGSPTEQEDEDSDWEAARRELSGRSPGSEPLFDRNLVLGTYGRMSAEYSAAKVEELRDALIQALKNASRIRQLKPEDRVLVCVTAPGAVTPGEPRRTTGKVTTRYGTRVGNGDVVVIKDETGHAARGSVMTLRVRKADAEEFAKGAIDLTQFRTRVQVSTYARPAGLGEPGLSF